MLDRNSCYLQKMTVHISMLDRNRPSCYAVDNSHQYAENAIFRRLTHISMLDRSWWGSEDNSHVGMLDK